MSYKDVSILRDADNNPIPQFYNPKTGLFEPIEGENGATLTKLTGSNLDQRGLAANKPTASEVKPGTTYWSVDTDPHADAIEVSDGATWTVI